MGKRIAFTYDEFYRSCAQVQFRVLYLGNETLTDFEFHGTMQRWYFNGWVRETSYRLTGITWPSGYGRWIKGFNFVIKGAIPPPPIDLFIPGFYLTNMTLSGGGHDTHYDHYNFFLFPFHSTLFEFLRETFPVIIPQDQILTRQK